MKLPIFQLASSVAPADRIRDLAKQILPQSDYRITEQGTKIELQNNDGKIEVDVGNGGFFAADLSKLWRFDPTSEKKRDLLAPARAEKAAIEFLKNLSLLPEVTRPFRMKPARTTGTMTAFTTQGKKDRKITQEDTTVLFDIEVEVSDNGSGQKTLPIVGGGGRFSVIFGEGGRVIGTRGVWRPPVGKPRTYEVIPQAKADEIFRSLTSNIPVKKFSAELAYYSAPAFTGQEMLFPVYVYSGIAEYGGKIIELRKVLIPATEIGQVFQSSQSQSQRKETAVPSIRPLPVDLTLVPGKTLPPGITVNRKLMLKKGLKFTDLFTDSSFGAHLVINPNITPILLKELGNLLGYYSAGTSWIGLSGGLSGSQNNAKGFVDELGAIGWNIRFNWGDANAWESDWRVNDDKWVDSADFVFYTGHANSDGWVLATPDDDFLHFTETAGAKDLWGANNLEWAVVAACGPLQDQVVGSGGDVLERWKDAFDGLHILMGYGQVTYDNEEEGKRLAKYSKAGSNIIQSWFRTGQEIQPGGIWVGAYYVGNNTGSTGNDHLWGVGSVGPDIPNPTWRACSWVPC